MSETTITVSKRAQEIVRADVSRAIKSGVAYAEYVAVESVTRESLPVHVAMFRGAYRTHAEAALNKAERALVIATEQKGDVDAAREALERATYAASGAAIKAYATKVRNGLSHHIAKAEQDSADEAALEPDEQDGDEQDGTENSTPDYLADIMSRIDVAVTAGLDAGDILAAVTAHVNALLS